MDKVREERQAELDSLRVTASKCEATIAKVCKKTSAEETKMRSERDSAASRYCEVLVSARRSSEAREKRKDNAADTLAMFGRVYGEGCNDQVGRL